MRPLLWLLCGWLSLPLVLSASLEVYDSAECGSRLNLPEVDSFFSQHSLVEACERSDDGFVRFTLQQEAPSRRCIRFSLFSNGSCSDSSLLYSLSSTFNSTALNVSCHEASFTSRNRTTGLWQSARRWVSLDLSTPTPPPSLPTDSPVSDSVAPLVVAGLIAVPVLIAVLVVAVLWCCNRAPRQVGPVRSEAEAADWYLVLSEGMPDNVREGEDAV